MKTPIIKLKPGMKLEDESNSSSIVRTLVYRLYHAIDKVIESTTVNSLLDVGCGQGWHLQHLSSAHPNLKFSGIDLRDDAIYVAKQVTSSIVFKVGDVYELPYEDRSFDTLLLVEILEHLIDPYKAIEEAKRVSSKYCIFTIPHEPFFRLSNLVSGKYIKRLGSFPDHKQHWTLGQFRRMLNSYFAEVTITKSFPWLIALCCKDKPIGPTVKQVVDNR